MRVPGTTVALALLPGYVELRDRGLVKKKIKVKARSFDDVLEEVDSYFKNRGKILPPGVLRDTIVSIGVPQAKMILAPDSMMEDEKEVAKSHSEKVVVEIQDEEIVETLEHPVVRTHEVVKNEDSPVTTIETPKKDSLSKDDLPDIEEALSVVESISDSFMAPRTRQEEQPPSPPAKISISLSGSEEIVASTKSQPTVPNNVPKEIELEELPPPDIEEAIHETPDSEDVHMASEEVELADELLEETQPEIKDTTIMEEPAEPEPVIKELIAQPSHAVKPLIQAKVIIVGEVGVGKSSLIKSANLRTEDEFSETETFCFIGVQKTPTHRVDLHVWDFDAAVDAKINRQTYYSDVDVAIIVYSIEDRWSFESVDFWLKESTVLSDKPPPIIIVANKKDARESTDSDPLEPCVTSDEGFKLAERIANALGTEEQIHPVGFIETSCKTGEGVEAVFMTAAEFFSKTL